MLTVHHLAHSQSERIIWLCEEIGLPYELIRYERESSGRAPDEYRALHPLQTAPIITDGELTLRPLVKYKALRQALSCQSLPCWLWWSCGGLRLRQGNGVGCFVLGYDALVLNCPEVRPASRGGNDLHFVRTNSVTALYLPVFNARMVRRTQLP